MYNDPMADREDERQAAIDNAMDEHYSQFHQYGETTFTSEEETREISRASILETVTDDFADEAVEVLFTGGAKKILDAAKKIQEAFQKELESQMEEARNDFYEHI